MNPDKNNGKKGAGTPPPPKKRNIFTAILWAVVVVIFFNFMLGEIRNAGTEEVPYSEFIQMVEKDEVATVELANNKYTFYHQTRQRGQTI